MFRPLIQPAPAALGARIVFVIATVMILTLCATRQSDAKNVRTASRVETVKRTSTSAIMIRVMIMPTAATQLVPSSVSAILDTHSTTQLSVKVCFAYQHL